LTSGRQAATSKKIAAAKGKPAAKEKDREKQSQSVMDQLNTAMPHWTLRIVSDADIAVSLSVNLPYLIDRISDKT